MKDIRFPAKQIGQVEGFYNQHYNRSYRNNDYYSGYGSTDVANDDAVLKILAANKAAGPFGKVLTQNRAMVSRCNSSFSVYKPGFYIYKHLRKTSKAKYSVIFFLRKGNYMTHDIYEHMKNHGESFDAGLFGEHPLFGGEDFEKSVLKGTIPIDIYRSPRTPTALLANTFALGIYEALMLELGGAEALGETGSEEVIKVESEFALCNKLIPVFVTSDNVISLKSDGTVSDFVFKNAKKASTSRVYYNVVFGVSHFGPRSTKNHFCSGNGYLPGEVVFYDPITDEVVWSDEAQNQLAAFISTNKKVIKASFKEYIEGKDNKPLKDLVKGYLGLMSPDDFKKYMTDYLTRKGFPSLTITEVWPAIMCGGYSKHNWKTDRGSFKYTKDMGYYVEVSLNGRQIIGSRSGSNFTYLCVKHEVKNDRIRLIHSSRCQHISSWSGNTTDQGYSHWEISDWITGPMAEAQNIKIGDCPAVFMGRNVAGKSRKKLAMEALRARLGNL